MRAISSVTHHGGVETERVTLGMSSGDRTFVLVGFPVAGAVLGLVLPFLWRLVADVGWLPFRGPVSALMSLDEGWQWLARLGILAVAGLVLALVAIAEDTVVSVGREDIAIIRDGTTRTIPREQVAGVYHDGKKLIIETAQGRRLLDAPIDGAKTKAGPAFTRFGYPWEND